MSRASTSSFGFLGRAALTLAAAALMAGVVGCGGDDDQNGHGAKGEFSGGGSAAASNATLTSAHETLVARRAQLRLDDFPAGWQEHDEPGHEPADCEGIRGPRDAASAMAISPNFQQGDYPAATSAVYLYADEAEAGAMFATMSARETLVCLAEKLAEKIKDRSGPSGPGNRSRLSIGEASTARVPVHAAGDQREGGRVTLPLTAQGVDVDLIVDYIFVRVGRGVALLAVGNTFSAFDENLRANLTVKLTRRLAAELS